MRMRGKSTQWVEGARTPMTMQCGQRNDIFLHQWKYQSLHVGSKYKTQSTRSYNFDASYRGSMWSWRDAQKCLQNLSGAKNGASRIGWRRLEWRGSGQSTDSAAAFTILKHGSDERERKLYGQLIALQNWEVSTVLKTQIPYISPSRSLYPKEETELCSQNVSQPYSPLWSVILRNQINTFHHCESSRPVSLCKGKWYCGLHLSNFSVFQLPILLRR